MTGQGLLRITAPAKINLFLHITGRRDDGYHRLQTVFQLLDIGDSLVVATNRSGNITLDGPDLGIADSDNLVTRAAMALKALPTTPAHCGAHLRLEKRLPSGGGLGGGSSDAASTLLALNALWGLQRSNAELQRIGAGLGADVPVFVLGHSAWAEGIGEQLTPLDLPPAYGYGRLCFCHCASCRRFILPRGWHGNLQATVWHGISYADGEALSAGSSRTACCRSCVTQARDGYPSRTGTGLMSAGFSMTNWPTCSLRFAPN